MPTAAARPVSSTTGRPAQFRPEQPNGTALQGPEGRELVQQIGKVEERLADVTTARFSLAEDIEAVDYEPIPPKGSFQMDVYVHMLGRGEPMPYALDDDDLE